MLTRLNGISREMRPYLFIGFAVFVVLALGFGVILFGRGFEWMLWLVVGASLLMCVMYIFKQRSAVDQQLQLAAVPHDQQPVHRVAGTDDALTDVPPDTDDDRPVGQEEVVLAETRFMAWSLTPAILVLAYACFVLAMVMIYSDQAPAGTVLLIVMALIAVIWPFTDSSLHVVRMTRMLWSSRKWTILAIIAITIGTIIGGILIWEWAWLASALIAFFEWLWEMIRFILQSQTTAAVAVCLLGVAKLGLSFVAWRVERVFLLESTDKENKYGYDIRARRGVFLVRWPIAEGAKVTNLEPRIPKFLGVWPMPWWKLIVEDAGQVQGFDKLSWLPRPFLNVMGLSEKKVRKYRRR